MNKISKMNAKLLVVAGLILAMTFLSAGNVAGSTLNTVGNHTDTPQLVNICHATDDPANPYEELAVNSAELNVHRSHLNDIIPMPANGCPATLVFTSDGKITICHATGSQNNPYNEITVSMNGLNGHGTHEGDIFPAPEGGCPSSSSVIVSNTDETQLLTVCHATDNPANPYEELTVNTAELNVHRGHLNDIITLPGNGCPATQLITSDGKITICHATGSQNNPYDEITVRMNGLNGHGMHEGDIFPAPEGGCPITSSVIVGDIDDTPQLTACHATGDPANPYEEINVTYDINPIPANGCPTNPVLISDGKITICHATGSQNTPFDEVTVNIVGLNGHGTHEGDVFLSPDGNCPTSSDLISNYPETPYSFGNRITITLGTIGNRITTFFSGFGKRKTSTTTLINVCHATDDPANPYDEITVNDAELNVHSEHPDDIIPVPAAGCPTNPVIISNGKITICHATGSQTNPYNEIKVSLNGLKGHGTHEGDVFPASEGDCPTSLELVSDNMITICHVNGSQTNPYDEIIVSVDDLSDHDGHQGDFFPVPEGGCPSSLWTTNNSKITICHATGSQKNPYNEITVSINGLNGHGGHAGDIIPAPAGGCPTSPQVNNSQDKKPNKGKP